MRVTSLAGDAQRKEKFLVAGWMAAFEQFMPLLSFRLVQTDFLKHRDLFFKVYMIFHIEFQLGISALLLFRHGHDAEKFKV